MPWEPWRTLTFKSKAVQFPLWKSGHYWPDKSHQGEWPQNSSLSREWACFLIHSSKVALPHIQSSDGKVLPPETVQRVLTVCGGWLKVKSVANGREDGPCLLWWTLSAALRAGSKQVLMDIAGQPGITQKLLMRRIHRSCATTSQSLVSTSLFIFLTAAFVKYSIGQILPC